MCIFCFTNNFAPHQRDWKEWCYSAPVFVFLMSLSIFVRGNFLKGTAEKWYTDCLAKHYPISFAVDGFPRWENKE